MAKWHITNDSVDYIFRANPQQATETRKKNIQTHYPCSPDGNPFHFEGRRSPREYTFNGVVYSEAQYHAMIGLFAQRNQIQIEDDLGRTFSVYITSFEPEPAPSRNYPWRHTYTVACFELDWVA